MSLGWDIMPVLRPFQDLDRGGWTIVRACLTQTSRSIVLGRE
jgi:hypothetical protein